MSYTVEMHSHCCSFQLWRNARKWNELANGDLDFLTRGQSPTHIHVSCVGYYLSFMYMLLLCGKCYNLLLLVTRLQALLPKAQTK